ncbi:MAG: hypothetical protein JRN52_16160 [Nitrososphaerota archaeon]|nr:hypothetical protein [Nitrososphaerota archaeon]
MKVERVLTALLVVVAIAALALVVSSQVEQARIEYNISIEYSLSKQGGNFDYSCDEPFYSVFLRVSNNGSKVVNDFTISISNGLCKGAVPPLPSSLNSGQSIQIYLYTTKQNGTITISGNNTLIYVNF